MKYRIKLTKVHAIHAKPQQNKTQDIELKFENAKNETKDWKELNLRKFDKHKNMQYTKTNKTKKQRQKMYCII